MRDLAADLKICNAATRGPWSTVWSRGLNKNNDQYYVENIRNIVILGPYSEGGRSKKDAEFIAAAREGWPEAITRAIKAEAEVERLRWMVKSITGGLDEAIEAVHYLEAENALLRKVADLVNTMQESESGYSARLAEIEMLKALEDYQTWKEGQDG